MSEGARKLAASDTNQDQSFPERAQKLAAEFLDINNVDDSKWPDNLRVSRALVPHLEKVYTNLRQQLKREPDDKMEDPNVNTMIWGTFMMATQQADVHLGNDYVDSLHSTKNQPQKDSETIVRCNKKVDQRTSRNSRNVPDRLAPTFLAKDNSVYWQSSSFIYSKNQCILWFSMVYGQDESKSNKCMEGENRMVYEFAPNVENSIGIDGEPMESRVVKSSQDSQH